MIYEVPTIGLAMPTDADWGRLYKYNTTGDSGLIMPYRSYYARNFNPGTWNDISLGFIHCTMGNGGGDTANVVAERLEENAPVNLFHFGLSKTINGIVPVAVNPWFVGLRGIIGGVTQIMTSPLQLAQLYPTAVYNLGTAQLSGGAVQMPLSQGISATPFSMIGIRLIYNPTTGVLYMNYDTDTGVALASESANVSTLTTFLNGISSSTGSAFASFNIPNLANYKTFYIFWPYLTNRLKLHCVGLIKNA